MDDLRTLPQALADAARGAAGYVFVSPDGDRFVPYADVHVAALRVAGALTAAGLARDDLVALVLPDAEQFLTTLFGASCAGVLPASLYPPSPTADLNAYFDLTAQTLRAAGARAVVTTAALASGFEALRAECPELSSVIVRETLGGPPLDAASPHALDDIAFVQFTSGSTAAPKGVAISHRNLAANVEAIISHLAVRPDDVAVSWLPLYHDMGLIGMSIGAVYCQRRCVLLPPALFVKRPVEWLRAIRRHRGTVSFAPNFAYDLCVRRVKDRDLADLDLSSWRVAGCGAEPLNAATLAAFAERFAPVGFSAAKFVASYGLAEHVLAATFAPGGRAPRVERVSAGDLIERRRAVAADGARASVALVSCGVPLPGHQLKIAGEDGDALSERRVGEILLAGPSVMLGYYRQHARTAQAVRDGWLRTGDLGFVADGELFVCGRAKDLIIVNGRKYHPQDLEWAVDELPGVRRGRVVAFGTSETGRPDRVVVVVESSGTSAQDALTEAIRRRIGDLFGLFVDVVAVVPGGTVGRTTSGKVQRALTRARYERGELVGLA